MIDNNDEMIDVDPICRQFKQYFEIDNRCILSAKFGDGKSYFLSKFIQMYSGEYLFITIYPVNYQVMENGEIFELIKRDILLRLLSEEVIISRRIDYTKSFKLAYYLSQNYKEVFKNLIQIIPQFNFCGLDINLGNIHKGVKSIIDGYKEWEKKINETKEEDKADKFINGFNYKKGSINEFDVISQLIYNIISYYKKKNRKKIVLIIEDLDRIDPAHIFRILNVFSAHFDNKSYGEGNKYSFAKIITVCDYDNIKNIYHHVYGEKTDFIGYISKFSNIEPFNYSLHKLIKEYILNHLLDESLLKYKNICNALCDNIIQSLYKEMDGYNLRIVNERLTKAPKIISNSKIQLTKDLSGYYISSLNPFANFIAITKCFKIKEDDILSNKFIDEIIELVGTNWLLLSRLSNNCFLEKLQEEIKIIILGEYNYSAGSFRVSSSNYEIINVIGIEYFYNAENTLKHFLFERIDEIIMYYKNNIMS